MGKALGLSPKLPSSAPAPAPSEKTEAEKEAEAQAARQKAEAEARLASDRQAFGMRLRGRSAFLSGAGEAGFRLGGV